MSDADYHKPIPARSAPEPARGKPTPARSRSGDPPVSEPEADVAESTVVVDGVTWTVRVSGRSGSASGMSPPLLLLDFRSGDGDGGAELEALVVGRSLSGLSEEQLESALAGAEKPRDPDRKRSFFAESGQPRRR